MSTAPAVVGLYTHPSEAEVLSVLLDTFVSIEGVHMSARNALDFRVRDTEEFGAVVITGCAARSSMGPVVREAYEALDVPVFSLPADAIAFAEHCGLSEEVIRQRFVAVEQPAPGAESGSTGDGASVLTADADTPTAPGDESDPPADSTATPTTPADSTTPPDEGSEAVEVEGDATKAPRKRTSKRSGG